MDRALLNQMCFEVDDALTSASYSQTLSLSSRPMEADVPTFSHGPPTVNISARSC